MSASNDPAEAQGERMISLENELEGFLEATQDPAAWLMVFAAKDEIERLTLMNAAYKTVIDGATLDTRQKQAEIERLNSECDELMALVRRFRLGLGELESEE
jgi:hypothetical protein